MASRSSRGSGLGTPQWANDLPYSIDELIDEYRTSLHACLDGLTEEEARMSLMRTTGVRGRSRRPGSRTGNHVPVSQRAPGEGSYARIEREQRWVIAELPRTAQRGADILDRYILGTRLRLRRVDSEQGVVFKLGQKIRATSTEPEFVKLTNMYLSADEYAIVAALPAAELRKTRRHVSWQARSLAVDEFHGPLRGLLLAELELDATEHRQPAPPFAIREVTDDDRYSGGGLAFARNDDVSAILRDAPTKA